MHRLYFSGHHELISSVCAQRFTHVNVCADCVQISWVGHPSSQTLRIVLEHVLNECITTHYRA